MIFVRSQTCDDSRPASSIIRAAPLIEGLRVVFASHLSLFLTKQFLFLSCSNTVPVEVFSTPGVLTAYFTKCY